MPDDTKASPPTAPPIAHAAPDEPKMVTVRVLTDRPVDGRIKDQEFLLEGNTAKFFEEAELVKIIK